MASIPKKVADRLIAGIKQFQPVLTSAKQRDVGEADTVRRTCSLLCLATTNTPR